MTPAAIKTPLGKIDRLGAPTAPLLLSSSPPSLSCWRLCCDLCALFGRGASDATSHGATDRDDDDEPATDDRRDRSTAAATFDAAEDDDCDPAWEGTGAGGKVVERASKISP
jgi:hypothetical protein